MVASPGQALAAIVLLGAALRLIGIAGQSFWADEAFTLRVLGGGGLWSLPERVDETEAALARNAHPREEARGSSAPSRLLSWALMGSGEGSRCGPMTG